MTTFDERALASLPEVAGFTGDLRRQAFAEFEALPMPSQETEEWRYTDLSDFELTHSRPTRPGVAPTNLDDVPAEILAAAGDDRRPRRPADPARLRRDGDPSRPGARGAAA